MCLAAIYLDGSCVQRQYAEEIIGGAGYRQGHVARPGGAVRCERQLSMEGICIERTGASLLCLPPDSPDLNSIEEAWSKLKLALRTASARSGQALHQAVAWLLPLITPNDATARFRLPSHALQLMDKGSKPPPSHGEWHNEQGWPHRVYPVSA